MKSLLRATAAAGCRRRRRCCPGGFRPLSSPSKAGEEPSSLYFPVVIVGAGPTGATLAALLARLGVRSLLLEKSPVAGRAHPAAHFINARTMETFRRLPVAPGFGSEEEAEEEEEEGAETAATTKEEWKPKTTTKSKTISVADAVAAACPPRDQWRRFVYCGSAVNGPLLASVDHFDEEERRERERRERKRKGSGGGGVASEKIGSALSPVRVAHLPQHRLLPLLLGAVEHASRGGDGGEGGEGNGRLVDARFGCEVSAVRPLSPPAPSASSSSSSPASPLPATLAVDFFDAATGRHSTAEAGFVVAADGARSPTREAVIASSSSSSSSSTSTPSSPSASASRLGLSGTGPLQHLLSIHFACPSAGRALLLSGGEGKGSRRGNENSRSTRAAMLYFVFNSGVAGAVVAHNLEKGEFVLQAPYFPPLQSASDFSKEKIERLCRSALFGGAAGGERKRGGVAGDDLEVKAVRPWTMRARVAGAFHSNVRSPSPEAPSPPSFFLAGDAAHEFPPAGGLGMNTGIADASALAWRLAAAVKGGGIGAGGESSRLLSSYSSERAPAARAAAALSLANWRSALAVPRSLGLDDRAAEAASKAAAAAAGMLPLLTGSRGAAAAALEGVLSAGRAVFGGGTFAAVDEIRAARAKGALAKTKGGLRLLFPAYDLGVGCSAVEGAAVLDEENEDEFDDTGDDGEIIQKEACFSWFPPDTPDPAPDAPYVPSTVPGSRMLHAWLRTTAASASGAKTLPPWLELPPAAPSSSSDNLRRLSTLDLPPAREPSCVLIVRGGESEISSSSSSSPWSRAFLELMELARGKSEEGQQAPLPLRLAVVSESDAAAEAARENLRFLNSDLAEQVAFLVEEESESQGWSGEAVLVRPDGIVGWRARTKTTKAKAATTATGKGREETDASCSSSLLRALRRVYGFSGEPGDAPLPPWEIKRVN